jgi:hypothetical protein
VAKRSRSIATALSEKARGPACAEKVDFSNDDRYECAGLAVK